jgi:2-polyprenyl-6-methoxyphenol hydroxylase-like FAD-dependent oxidoreductase
MGKDSGREYDVIIVGARCAGSPLAALLARSGVRVAVLERDDFPSDTLSSHLFEADALAFLERLGAADQLRATGAPLVAHTDMRVEDVRLQVELPRQPGDIGGFASVRRTLLDPILAQAAEESGAELQMGARVSAHLEEDGRVTGVRFTREGQEHELRARLVVGADGRHSTIAKLCGAARYNLTPSRRLLFWAFFEDAHPGPVPTFLSHRFGEHFILAIPADSGLYQVLIWPERSELTRFRADLPAAFIDHAKSCEPVAEALNGARQVGKILGAIHWEGYFRKASGPGWVLTGDAGHFKSPAPGRGIGDAFLQAETLAGAIVGALEGPDGAIDRAMDRWGKWRDRELAEHYWIASDFEDPGNVPAVLVEVLRGLQRKGDVNEFFDVLNHRIQPSRVLSPPRVAGAVARLLSKGDIDRGALLLEVARLGARDMRRRWHNRHPLIETGDSEAPIDEPVRALSS